MIQQPEDRHFVTNTLTTQEQEERQKRAMLITTNPEPTHRPNHQIKEREKWISPQWKNKMREKKMEKLNSCIPAKHLMILDKLPVF